MSVEKMVGSLPNLLRILHLDLSRATEQTAVILSLLQGKGTQAKSLDAEVLRRAGYDESLDFRTAPQFGKTLDLSLRSMLGFLNDACCKGEVPDHLRTGSPGIWDQLGSPFGQLRDLAVGDTFEFAPCPLDGFEALKNGTAGAASVLAGGKSNIFKNLGADRYFVLTMSPYMGMPYVPAALRSSGFISDSDEAVDASETESATDDVSNPAEEFIKSHEHVKARICDILGELVKFYSSSAVKRRYEIAISCMAGESRQLNDLPKLIRCLCRTRRQTGSKVIAALSPFIPELQISVFADEVSSLQASVIAAGTRATRGLFLACPLDKQKNDYKLDDPIEFFGLDDFVSDDDVFVVATGITDSIVMRGTRFLGYDRAYTESLLLRQNTHSRRVIRTNHDNLGERRFRILWSRGGQAESSYLAEKKTDQDLFLRIKKELT